MKIIFVILGLSFCGFGVWQCHRSTIVKVQPTQINQGYGAKLAPEKEIGW